MPKKASGLQDRYWQQRVRSKAFRRDLTAVVKHELHVLSAERVREVLDAERVRALIREWDGKMVNQAIVAELVVHGNRRFAKRLQLRRGSILDLLDERLVADIDAILDEEIDLSPHIEDFVANLMRQEFMRRLLTDIIFTSIASFYQRVNPVFGALTTRVLEEQIKGFIRFFLPAIQRQATTFVLSTQNQRILLDFTRSIIRQLLNEPVSHYATMLSAGQQRKTEALVREAISNASVDAVTRQVTLAAWDEIYKAIGGKRVGDLFRFEEYGDWLAGRIVDAILPALSRVHVLRFIASETSLAAVRLRAPEIRPRGARK